MRNTYLTTTHLTAIGYNNADNGTEFTTCLGRIVWGHPLKPQDKTKDDVKVLNSQGEPIKQWSFGVAFPKADFAASVWPHLAAEAAKGYPNGVPANFTYKYKDGDIDVDSKGNPLSGKPGQAGCFILAFSTELQAPQCFVFENGAYRQIDETMLKTGDFVMIGVNAKWHAPGTARGSRPGLYVNPMTVLLCYAGEAIAGGGFQADPNAMFGAAPPQVAMPAGAAPVGAAPAAGGMPAAPGTMPGLTPPAAGMPGATAMPAAAAPVAAPPPPAPVPAVAPGRPTEPTHIHDNGNGTEQWFVNGAWDGQAHPVAPAAPAAPALPPPATDFVASATGMPAAPAAGMPTMPGAPLPR